MSATGIRAGGSLFRLPEGASATAAPVLRPLPGGGGQLCVGLLGGGALPAWILPGTTRPPGAWVLAPGAEGAVLLGGDALELPPPDAPPVPPPPFPQPRLRLAQREAPPELAPAAPAVPRGGFRLALPGGTLDLPFGALDRLLPTPPLHPVPDAPPGVRGMAWTASGAVLVLDPAPGSPVAEGAPLLAVLLAGGRRLGLPCHGATPLAVAPDSLPPALLLPSVLGAAPLAPPPAAEVPAPRRLLLLAQAGGATFALPIEEVAAILPPAMPRNAGNGLVAGIATHRGDVLPVLDAGRRLGREPVLAARTALPMIRLPGTEPAALAVSAVLGLRAVPEADMAPLTGAGLVSGMVRLDAAVIPVLRARALLAPLRGAGHGGAP